MTIPAIALRGLCVLPKMVVHFDVSRKKSIVALEKAMVRDQKGFSVPGSVTWRTGADICRQK